MKLGRFDLDVVPDGEFRLDGGAMFGVVPKSLWNRVKSCDEQNRIRMGTNCLLIRDGRNVVLVDTGIGDKLPEKVRAQFGMQEDAWRLPAALAAVGCGVGDVTHVLLSHLHFDHCIDFKESGDRNGWHKMIERPSYDLTVFKVHFGKLTLKIYDKGDRVLRIEAVAHNVKELRLEQRRRSCPS